MSETKKWDNNIYKFDVTEASKTVNPWLKNYGYDQYTYRPEQTFLTTARYAESESRITHGYPFTSWLQLAILYAVGLYTARE